MPGRGLTIPTPSRLTGCNGSGDASSNETGERSSGSGAGSPMLLPAPKSATSTGALLMRLGNSSRKHRIKRRGLSDTQTVLTLYLATICTGVSAVFLYEVELMGAVLILAQTVMILTIIAILESTGKGMSRADENKIEQ